MKQVLRIRFIYRFLFFYDFSTFQDRCNITIIWFSNINFLFLLQKY